jgi:hypothetical protein
MFGRRRLVSAAVMMALGLGSFPARAQDAQTAQRLEQLNKRAMEDYDLLEFENAKKGLVEALGLLRKQGLENDPIAARTYVNLGVLFIAGVKDRYKGFQLFVKALQVKPDAKLDPAIATPELQEVFDNARETVGVPRSPKSTPPKAAAPPAAPPPSEEASADVKGLAHKPIDEAPAGQPINVKAQIGSDLAASKLILFYRTPEHEEFATLPMTRNKKGVFVATIPADATNGRSLQYYIEARDQRGRALTGNGSASSPNIITVASASRQEDGEKNEHSTEVTKSAPPAQPSGRHDYWFGVALGTGVGLATGTAELAQDSAGRSINIATGLAPAMLHLAPEFGFFVSQHVALSVQGRIQVVTAADPQEPMRGQPASGAIAALGRVLYFFGRDTFRLYGGFAFGGGEMRHTVDVGTAVGINGATDTVNAGPVFFGPSFGLHYDLSDHVGLVGEIQALLGADDFTFNVDANLGLALHL